MRVRATTTRAALAAVVVIGVAAATAATPGPVAAEPTPPNVVVVLTDDQTLESLRVMTQTQALVADRGTTLEVAVATYPLCCPARATLLTGQYAHNTGVLANRSTGGRPGGYPAYRDGVEPQALPVALDQNGYETAFVGKYLNEWGADGQIAPPPGWDHWRGGVGSSANTYWRMKISRDGVLEDHTGEYGTDLVTDLSTELIDAHDPQTGPLFLVASYFAPHFDDRTATRTGRYRALPAPRHVGAFAAEPLPADPAFNHRDPAKPAYTRDRPRLDKDWRDEVRDQYRSELAALLAVDEGVAAIDAALERNGLRDDTIVIFTSDNGYLHGEHRHLRKKHLPYEPSIRVPLLIAGPDVVAGGSTPALTANVDVAATIYDYTGTTPLLPVDGVSLRPLLDRSVTVWDREVLLTNRTGTLDKPTYDGVRTATHTYVEYRMRLGTRHELFDLQADPSQLRNLVNPRTGVAFAPEDQAIVDALAARLDELVACAGVSCQ